MSDWVEFDIEVYCPHCGQVQWECIEFDLSEADKAGVSSPFCEFICQDCDKHFWIEAYLGFEIEVKQSLKKEPNK